MSGVGHRHGFHEFLDDEDRRARLYDVLNAAHADSEDGAPDLDGLVSDVLQDAVAELRELAGELARVRARDAATRALVLTELAEWVESGS